MEGKVYLVGAGPGDYKLITLKGLEAVRKADVIVYDRLVNPRYLKEAKEGCEIIYVGKESDRHTMPQEDINRLLAKKAKEGKVVVRLKGGDPYVFGRGGEEGEHLFNEGIEFEAVPGITSAIGGLCYAGIPITHRGLASSFHVITGHLKDESLGIDWKSIGALKGTLVFLMGMSNLKNIVDNLTSEGKESSTPAAIINWGTWHNQRVVTGTLENIYERAKREEISSPSLIVVGEVVKLRDRLNFFEKSPLHGKTIVVTRARTQNSTLVERIEEMGGNAIEIPAIKINKIVPDTELKEAVKGLSKYSHIIFTSVNAVKIFFEALFEEDLDSRALYDLKVTAIGRATAASLKNYGIRADTIPEKYIGEGIAAELKGILKPEDNILIPRSKEARGYLVDTLREICSVKEIKIYETTRDEGEKQNISELLREKRVDYITFTSSSTVENFISILEKDNIDLLKGVKLVSIGPATSETMRKHGLEKHSQAEEYTIDGVVKCITDDVGRN